MAKSNVAKIPHEQDDAPTDVSGKRLKSFIERLTSINRGRAFFTTPDTLGDYVLVDYIEHRRRSA